MEARGEPQHRTQVHPRKAGLPGHACDSTRRPVSNRGRTVVGAAAARSHSSLLQESSFRPRFGRAQEGNDAGPTRMEKSDYREHQGVDIVLQGNLRLGLPWDRGAAQSAENHCQQHRARGSSSKRLPSGMVGILPDLHGGEHSPTSQVGCPHPATAAGDPRAAEEATPTSLPALAATRCEPAWSHAGRILPTWSVVSGQHLRDDRGLPERLVPRASRVTGVHAG